MWVLCSLFVFYVPVKLHRFKGLKRRNGQFHQTQQMETQKQRFSCPHWCQRGPFFATRCSRFCFLQRRGVFRCGFTKWGEVFPWCSSLTCSYCSLSTLFDSETPRNRCSSKLYFSLRPLVLSSLHSPGDAVPAFLCHQMWWTTTTRCYWTSRCRIPLQSDLFYSAVACWRTTATS